MGVIKRGILGGFSGKVGNIVGSSWKGIAVMKSLPLSVANPRTAAQVAQRSDFTFTSKFASAILASVVKPLWDRFASQMSGYNHFIQTNISLLSDVADERFNDFKISVGKMAAAVGMNLQLDSGNDTVDVGWDDLIAEGFKLTTDLAYVVVSINDGEIIEGFATNTARDQGVAVVAMKENFIAGQKVVVWLSFLRVDGTVVSDSAMVAYTVI